MFARRLTASIIALLALSAGAIPAAADDRARVIDAWLGPVVGIERSSGYRPELPGRAEVWRGRLGLGGADRPMSFAAQLEAGYRVFHLQVYADPDPGRYARGAASQTVALRQAGLKVVDPDAPDPDALCHTLMLCLIELDRYAAAQTSGPPIVVVLEAAEPPAPDTRLERVVDLFEVAPAPGRPTWERMALEVETAIGRVDPHRMLIVAARADGAPPAAPAPFLIDRVDAVVIPARAAADEARLALEAGRFAVLLGARWADDDDPAHIGPTEAAAHGVHAIVLSQGAVRGDVGAEEETDRAGGENGLCPGPCRWRRHTAPTQSSPR